jgi:hypothetical protein
MSGMSLMRIAMEIYNSDMFRLVRSENETEKNRKQVLKEMLITQSLLFTPFKNMKTVNYSSCPIGLGEFHVEDLVVVIKMCGHIFDINELQTWLQKKNTCPLCRCNIHHGAKIENSDISDLLVDIKEMY